MCLGTVETHRGGREKTRLTSKTKTEKPRIFFVFGLTFFRVLFIHINILSIYFYITNAPKANDLVM